MELTNASIMEMTRYWIDLYKKIKADTATEEEKAKMDKATYWYIDYVNETGSFYIPTQYVSPTGYKLGVFCDNNKKRRMRETMRESTIDKWTSLGFFWGRKDAWLSTAYNINPIRREILRLLDKEYVLDEETPIIYTYVIDDVNYTTLRDIEHKGKLNEFWSGFWEHYVDYVESQHSSFIPEDYVSPDGYTLGEIAEGLRVEYENKTMSKNVYNWLNSVGFGWNAYSSNMEILAHNIGYQKKRLNLYREKVTNRYIDPVNVDNFCLHYMHYVASTDCYDTPVEYICQDGYKLGENAMAYRKLYAVGSLPSTAIKCLNVLGFPLPKPTMIPPENEE